MKIDIDRTLDWNNVLCLAVPVSMEEDFSNSSSSMFSGGLLKFGVIVEKDEDGCDIASVPELPGCHTQGKTLDEVIKRVKEAIQAYLDAEGTKSLERIELVGLQFVEVPAR
jgi:predicted RNase H-like HicB family nuclease